MVCITCILPQRTMLGSGVQGSGTQRGDAVMLFSGAMIPAEAFPGACCRKTWEFIHTTNSVLALHTPAFPCSISSSLRMFQGKQCFIHDLAGLSQQLSPTTSCSMGSAASPGHGTQISCSEPSYSRIGRQAQGGVRLEHGELKNARADPVPSSCCGLSGEGARGARGRSFPKYIGKLW